MDIENFLKLLQEDFSVSVNKTIKLLHNFLQTNRRSAFQQLTDTFTYINWRQLAQFTLISVQVFNRQRAEEIERISIDDYKHQEDINARTNPDLYESLSSEVEEVCLRFLLFFICIYLLYMYKKTIKI
ncbi:hypothetical protein ACFW04_008274 [Cataglyphis niger]